MIRIHGYPMSILGPWFLAWEALTVEGGQQCHCGSGWLGTSWDLWLCLKLAPYIYTPAEIATLVWENVGKWGWSILGVPGKGIQLEFAVYSSWLPKKSRLCNWSRYLKFLPPVGAKALAATALWSLNTAEDMFASSCWGKKIWNSQYCGCFGTLRYDMQMNIHNYKLFWCENKGDSRVLAMWQYNTHFDSHLQSLHPSHIYMVYIRMRILPVFPCTSLTELGLYRPGSLPIWPPTFCFAPLRFELHYLH